MRIAFFAPLSPMRGGVADYSEELLPYLAHGGQIDVYTRDGLTPTNPAISGRFPIYGYSTFSTRDRQHPYDRVIYQLGCSGDHVPDYENLMARPGWVVLHELNLSGIIGARTFGRDRPYGYVKAVLLNEGIWTALQVAWRFARTRQFPGYLEYDFSRVALLHSRGVIVHNRFMHDLVLRRLARWRVIRPVYQVPMGICFPPEIDRADANLVRKELGIEADAFVIGSFGVVHESKGILAALCAFERLLAQFPNAVYFLVGAVESPAVQEAITKLGLGDRVRLTGYVTRSRFYQHIAAADLCVNLRLPRTGGTSASLLRLLSLGRPVIISDQAQFSEIPDGVCLKVRGDEVEDSVLRHMVDVATHPEKGEQIGRRARRHVERHHSLEGSASAYFAALNCGFDIQE